MSTSLPWCTCCRATRVVDSGTHLALARKTGDSRARSIKWQIASGSLLQKNHALPGKLCDFVAEQKSNGDAPKTHAIELKSRVQDVKSIVKQLQAGADLLQAGTSADSSFRAVLVRSGRLGPQELRVLRTLKVRFRGRNYPVSAVRSGSLLA